jgi:hypothetical protein
VDPCYYTTPPTVKIWSAGVALQRENWYYTKAHFYEGS